MKSHYIRQMIFNPRMFPQLMLMVVIPITAIILILIQSETNYVGDASGEVVDNNTCATAEGNLVSNFEFDQEEENWGFFAENKSARFLMETSDNVCGINARVRILRSAKNIQMFQRGIILENDVLYTLSFRAKANRTLAMTTTLVSDANQRESYGFVPTTVGLSSEWKRFEVPFTLSGMVTNEAVTRLRFAFSNTSRNGDNYYLDSVQISKEIAPTPTIDPTPTDTPYISPTPSGAPKIQDRLHKKVYYLILDPILTTKNNMKMSEYMSYHQLPPWEEVSTQINRFKAASSDYLQFEVVKSAEISDESAFLQKLDGFRYTEEQWLDVVSGRSQPHSPDIANYYEFLNDPELDICGSFNRGEIDELWLYAGPWFGFYESAMASNGNYNSFWVNGPTYEGTACDGLLPVGIANLHTFGHRAEATMAHVYGGWEENRTNHRWDAFALNRGQSPDYQAFGCGSVHYSANSRSSEDDYDFNIPDTVPTYCEAFGQDPSRTVAELMADTVDLSCQAWGCNVSEYEMYWWHHWPKAGGVGPDGKLNNWWLYVFEEEVFKKLGPEPTPMPRAGVFSNLSASFPPTGPAEFRFDYSGIDNRYVVEVSTLPDMSHDVYVSFAEGVQSPVVEQNPLKWDKYSCGRDLYWRVSSGTQVVSPIVHTVVGCE